MAARINVSNPQASAAIITAADYLAKKTKQAEAKLEHSIAELAADFEDEHGERWQLVIRRAPTPDPSHTP